MEIIIIINIIIMRERDRQTDRQTDKERERERQTDRQRERQAGRQIDRDTERQRERESGGGGGGGGGRERGWEGGVGATQETVDGEKIACLRCVNLWSLQVASSTRDTHYVLQPRRTNDFTTLGFFFF